MTEAVGAAKNERTEGRLGYRSGYYTRGLVTRLGKIELRVPQDRQGRFSTELFERYQRSDKALLAALAEMYIQGVSTRKVKAIPEELWHSFSASSISTIVKKLDGELSRFARRRLEEPFPYLILDARYEKVRVDHVIHAQAVLIAIGIDWEGRRQILGVDLANRESRSSWRDFLTGLKERGLHGVAGRGGLDSGWRPVYERNRNIMIRLLSFMDCQGGQGHRRLGWPDDASVPSSQRCDGGRRTSARQPRAGSPRQRMAALLAGLARMDARTGLAAVWLVHVGSARSPARKLERTIGAKL